MQDGPKANILDTAKAFIQAFMTERSYTMFDYIAQDGFVCNAECNGDSRDGIDYPEFRELMTHNHIDDLIQLKWEDGTPTFTQSGLQVTVETNTQQLRKGNGWDEKPGNHWYQVTGPITLHFVQEDDSWKIHQFDTTYTKKYLRPENQPAIVPQFAASADASSVPSLDSANTGIHIEPERKAPKLS